MGDRFPFSSPSDTTIIWNDSINTTLGDSLNDGYVTAPENNTQYLSVLDSSNEISLNNLTLTNTKLEQESTEFTETYVTTLTTEENSADTTPAEESNEQQVVVYTVEGSDELYGIQVRISRINRIEPVYVWFTGGSR